MTSSFQNILREPPFVESQGACLPTWKGSAFVQTWTVVEGWRQVAVGSRAQPLQEKLGPLGAGDLASIGTHRRPADGTIVSGTRSGLPRKLQGEKSSGWGAGGRGCSRGETERLFSAQTRPAAPLPRAGGQRVRAGVQAAAALRMYKRSKKLSLLLARSIEQVGSKIRQTASLEAQGRGGWAGLDRRFTASTRRGGDLSARPR